MGEDGQRAGRLEQRNLTQLETELTNLREELNAQIELLGDTLLEHSAEIDRVDNRVDNTMAEAHQRGANVPLTPFHGNRNEDFAQYIKQFELISDANNYAVEKRAQILASYLRDKAFFIYDSLDAATKSDYEALKVALCEKFQTTDYRRYAHQKFQERNQRSGETVPDYACDVHRMGLAALANIEAEQRDALIREKFIAGLLPQLRELIMYSNPATFHEAMTLAERLEGLQASKTDNAAKSILLLQEINDRVASLEIQSKRGGTAERYAEIAYMANEKDRPKRNVGNGPRNFNLGNFRQEFKPNGMVCYRCNRTGHMSRNCGRNRDMSTVVCLVCNRMGHFARDCQRRGINFPRNGGQPGGVPSRRIPEQRGYASGANRTNRSMALTLPGTQGVTEPVVEQQAELMRWQPLVASLWCESPPEAQKDVEMDTTNTEPMEVDVGTPAKRLEKSRRGKPSENGKTVKPQVNRLLTNRVQRTKLEQLKKLFAGPRCWIALVVSLCLVTCVRPTFAIEPQTTFQQSGPMLCQANEGKSLWKLPSTFNCPEGNHTVDKEVSPMTLRLYKRNYIQYKSDAWKCVRVTEEVKTFTYFFGDENLKRDKKYAEPVSAEDCIAMKRFKSCKGQPMIFQGGIYQTSNKMEWYYPGGGINCCRWKQFTVTNCYMYKTQVYKRHGNPTMESTAGEVSTCKYRTGQCVLRDGAFLLWEVNNRSSCELLPWKRVKGKMFGTSWLSDDSNLALTFTQDARTRDCRGRPLLLSDQGIATKPINRRRKPREIHDYAVRTLEEQPDSAGKGGIVSFEQLAASMQALEERWEQNVRFAFSHALNNVCNFMRSVIELLKTQALANPTMAIRSLTNQSDVFARSGGNVIEVFPCTQLNNHHYWFQPMNGSCTAQLPIKFKVNNKTSNGFLDPVTNIIHRYSVPVDCRLVKQVPVQIKESTYIYHANNGELTPAHAIPEIKVLQWNVEPIIDMKATIFHEIVIYNWDELQTHISLNDIIGGLDHQRTVLQQMGIAEEEEDPHRAAEQAVTHIMNWGYFGFLHGLATNIFQVWTFLVCLYVTLCVIIVHCLPIRAMPAALNVGNAAFRLKDAWKRWRRKRTLQQRENRPRSIPESSEPLPEEEAQLSKLMANLLERANQRPQRAIMPPEDIEMVTPSAPLVDHELSTESKPTISTFRWRSRDKPNADVQPFRINALKQDSGITVTVGVGETAIKVLLDTGASSTLISPELIQRLGKAVTPTAMKLQSITDHELDIVGTADLIMILADTKVHGTVFVVAGLPYQAIMGVDFMAKFGRISIDFLSQTVEINGNSLPVFKKASTDHSENGSTEPGTSVKTEVLSRGPTPIEKVESELRQEWLAQLKLTEKTYLLSPITEDTAELLDFETAIEEVFIDKNGEIVKLDTANPRFAPASSWTGDGKTNSCDQQRRQTKQGSKLNQICAVGGTSEIAIYACIEGMTVKTLIDTGSSLTVIPLRVAKLLRNATKPAQTTAISITGHELHIVGEVNTIVRVGNKDMRGLVTVARDCPYELIIGTDLLQQLGSVRVDFDQKKIDLGTESVPMAPYRQPVGIFLCQHACVVPKATMTVMGMCFGLTPTEVEERSLCRFSPSDKLLSKYDVISQESVVSPQQKLIPVSITNCDKAPKYLPEKATLGQLDVLTSEEIAVIEAQVAEEAYVRPSKRRTPAERMQLQKELYVSPGLTEKETDQLQSVIEKYEILFARHEYDLGETSLTEHCIDTGDARPISQKPYRTPHSLRPYLHEKIAEMLEHGIIQPSKSNWSSPVVLVKKKDTTELRFCVDNRKLNDVTIKDNYPLKRIEEAFDMLHEAKCFATLDLQSGYWQIPIRKSDQSKTAFITSEGLYEYTKMNFGLCNAPATFQRLMDQVLRGLDLKICMSYIDDIIVPASSVSQLVERLEAVFQRLLAAGLKLKLRKCRFGLSELKFLGYIVSSEGLKADPEKIEKILNAVPPHSRDELRTFIGFAGWCKRFIEGNAQIAWPLTDLLKQTKAFAWNFAAQKAFDALKKRYSEPPILAYPNMAMPFIICTDASNWAIGAVLCQKDDNSLERPLSYDSRVLNKSERNYSTIEKEMLAIFWAVTKKYRVYVYGNQFTVFTDHKPLLGVWKAPPNDGRLGRWCVRMQEYRPDMTLEYREGKANVVADYLSRMPGTKQADTTAMVLATTTEIPSIREEQLNDETFGALLRYVETQEVPQDPQLARLVEKWAPSYTVIDGVLNKQSPKYKKWLIALPVSLREQVLIANHDSLLSGHLGIRKTLSKIEKKYYWPKYYHDVVDWCRGCMACQARKPPAHCTKAPMHSTSISYINQRWAWDICGPLPLSQQGNKYILVCMEYFTKFPEVFAISDTKAERLAKLFVTKIVLRYGCPEILLSDQGANVHSNMIQEICKLLDIEKLRTSPYHPQSDGLVERFNRTLHQMLSMYVNDGHTDWCEYLPFLLFAYRSSVHESTKESPFFLMYGYDPVMPLDMSYMPAHSGYVATDDDYKAFVLSALLKSRRTVTDTIAAQQQKQKSSYDKDADMHTFVEGDRVLVYTPVTKKGRTRKFARNWVGPYRVLRVAQNGANIQIQAIGKRRANSTSWIHVNRAKRLNAPIGPWITPAEVPAQPLDNEKQTAVTGAQDSNGEQPQSTDVAKEHSSKAVAAQEVAGPASQKLNKNQRKNKCTICRKRKGDSSWIGCDTCTKWFHFSCAGITEEPTSEEWHCARCSEAPQVTGTGTVDHCPSSSESDAESTSTVVTISGDY